jgi:hypothetical protein
VFGFCFGFAFGFFAVVGGGGGVGFAGFYVVVYVVVDDEAAESGIVRVGGVAIAVRVWVAIVGGLLVFGDVSFGIGESATHLCVFLGTEHLAEMAEVGDTLNAEGTSAVGTLGGAVFVAVSYAASRIDELLEALAAAVVTTWNDDCRIQFGLRHC